MRRLAIGAVVCGLLIAAFSVVRALDQRATNQHICSRANALGGAMVLILQRAEHSAGPAKLARLRQGIIDIQKTHC